MRKSQPGRACGSSAGATSSRASRRSPSVSGCSGPGSNSSGISTTRNWPRNFARCRLFALPSLKEGFGLVYLEAMAHGRPCLGARAAATPEFVTETTGILVEAGNVPAIAAGLLEGLQRPWSEAAILERARHFSYQVFRERLAELLPLSP